jgi:hypothetical protein
MDNPSKLDSAAVRKTITDVVAVPVILFFGLMSLGPLAGVFIPGGDALRIGINIAFLLTSLYGVITGALIVKALMWSDLRVRSGLGLDRLKLAVYGGVWTVIYLIYLQMPN